MSSTPSLASADRPASPAESLVSRLLVVLTGPVIWSCAVPLLLLDLFASAYQAVCFPAYGIPKVRRGEYLVFDRHRLRYLSVADKVNCGYCAYANGILAYVTEVVARTEQYWCPIKHARAIKRAHSRYWHFLEYGDEEQYRRRLEEVRHAFDDLANRINRPGNTDRADRGES